MAVIIQGFISESGGVPDHHWNPFIFFSILAVFDKMFHAWIVGSYWRRSVYVVFQRFLFVSKYKPISILFIPSCNMCNILNTHLYIYVSLVWNKISCCFDCYIVTFYDNLVDTRSQGKCRSYRCTETKTSCPKNDFPSYESCRWYSSSSPNEKSLGIHGHQWPLLLAWFNFNPSMDK